MRQFGCSPIAGGILWSLLLCKMILAQGAGTPAAGIQVDPQGVVQTIQTRPESPAALKKRLQEFQESRLAPELVAQSERRLLSLRELNKEVQSTLDAGEPMTPALLTLCGLQRLDEVWVIPEQQDIVLVGPAEGFAPDALGRWRGVESGQPPLLLEDLICLLRAFEQADAVGCSIDPTAENMAALQRFLQQNSGPTTAGAAAQKYQVMARILGPQNVSVWGVPLNSHVATVLVEADLRMKRISLGNEPSGVKEIRSQLALLRPQGNSLQRWWFVPDYTPIQTNPERTTFRLGGPRVKLLAQEEYANAQGERFDAAQTRQSTQEFARRFTEHYAALAERQFVFAELRNVFDLAVLAALLRKEQLCRRAQCPLETLFTDTRYTGRNYPEPKTVPSQSTSRLAGTLMLGLVGGVELNPQPVLQFEVVPATDPLPDLQPGKLFEDP